MLHRSWLLAGLLLTGLACAGRGGDSDEPDPVNNPVRVEVTNNYPLAIEVVAVGGGITHRMGTVHPGMVARFVIPQNLVGAGGVELQAHPPAQSATFRTDPLLLAPGTIVDFVVTPQLFNSTATLRR